jgi:hypothetical protein
MTIEVKPSAAAKLDKEGNWEFVAAVQLALRDDPPGRELTSVYLTQSDAEYLHHQLSKALDSIRMRHQELREGLVL